MAAQNMMPKFNFSEIPESSRLVLLSIIHHEANEYLKQPGVAEKFERWKAERELRRSKKGECNETQNLPRLRSGS